MMGPLTLVAILGSLSLSVAAQLLLRKGMLVLPALTGLHIVVSLSCNAWIWGGLFCYAVSVAPWLFVLSRLPVSVAYPMVSIGYVLTAILGWFFLGEVVTLSRLGGIMLICAGVVLVARSF